MLNQERDTIGNSVLHPGGPVVKTLTSKAASAGSILVGEHLVVKKSKHKAKAASVTNSIKPLKTVHVKNLERNTINPFLCLFVLNMSLSLFFAFSVFFNWYVHMLSLHVVRFPTDSLFPIIH